MEAKRPEQSKKAAIGKDQGFFKVSQKEATKNPKKPAVSKSAMMREELDQIHQQTQKKSQRDPTKRVNIDRTKPAALRLSQENDSDSGISDIYPVNGGGLSKSSSTLQRSVPRLADFSVGTRSRNLGASLRKRSAPDGSEDDEIIGTPPSKRRRLIAAHTPAKAKVETQQPIELSSTESSPSFKSPLQSSLTYQASRTHPRVATIEPLFHPVSSSTAGHRKAKFDSSPIKALSKVSPARHTDTFFASNSPRSGRSGDHLQRPGHLEELDIASLIPAQMFTDVSIASHILIGDGRGSKVVPQTSSTDRPLTIAEELRKEEQENRPWYMDMVENDAAFDAFFAGVEWTD